MTPNTVLELVLSAIALSFVLSGLFSTIGTAGKSMRTYVCFLNLSKAFNLSVL